MRYETASAEHHDHARRPGRGRPAGRLGASGRPEQHVVTDDHGDAPAGQDADCSQRHLDEQPVDLLLPLAAVFGRRHRVRNIDNATQRTYTLRSNDVDQTIRVVVTASNADGQTSANSAATDVISSNIAPKNTAAPAITSTAKVGEELTAGKGTWTGGARSFAFQWQR